MLFPTSFLKNKANFAIIALIMAFFVLWPTGQTKAAADAALIGSISSLSAATPGIPVADIGLRTSNISDKITKTISDIQNKWWKTWSAKLVGTTLRNTVNRMAYDAANAIATANEGQKPLWVVEPLGTYFANLGDAATGDFIDGLGKTWALDLCQPPDPAIKARIGLGLIQQQRPTAPNCTLSELATNYSSAWEKYSAMKSGDYLKAIQVSFEPGGSEIGSAFTLFGRTEEVKLAAANDAKTAVTVNQGWLDVRNIAGNIKGVPQTNKTALENAQKNQSATLLSTTGDALVDAANIFLNQLAYEGMQRGLREIGKGKTTSSSYNYNSSSAFEDVIQYGVKIVNEKLASIIKPRFDVRSDYSVLSELAICPDKNNPGPNNCVIDDNFSQAISEKLTVAESLDKGYLHADWLVSDNSKAENAYTLRSATVLRKFRVVPVGWEQAMMIAASKGYKVTLMDLVTCFDSKDKYNTYSDNFDKTNASWCEGLVDPNWVLKTPLNTCRKQGVGAQILTSLPTKDENGLSALAVTRAGEYCADEQTCIQEKNDGSCEVYGYCNEEKRTWSFNTDSCEPIYNTCQTFTNTTNKKEVSYLENTLNYSTCNSSNAGCRQYVYGGSYASSTNQVLWDKKYSLYLNDKAQACNSKDEACTKLLRGKPGWDSVNFVMNSDFSANALGDSAASSTLKWPVSPASTNASIMSLSGTKVLSLEGTSVVSLYSDNNNSVLPAGMTILPGWSYSLSADVYLDEGDKVVMSFTEDNVNSETVIKKGWQKLTASVLTRDNNINDLKFSISGVGANVKLYIKNIQLTPNDYASSYANYGTYPAYEKIIPAYLESSCYVNATGGTKDYQLKAGAPAVCNNFARKCNREEVGCETFTAAKDNFAVAAKAQPADYCKQECNGYDTYIARESYFANTSADNLIPASTKTCSAQSVGCVGFTNLDAISQGGESQEYYTYIRQCIKPDTTSCGDFYSWEGNSTAGYQLKGSSLKKDLVGDPALVNASLAAACTKDIYYLPSSDPRYNADCREFYNKNGSITYRLLSNTFSCSDNCHPYRLNEKNTDINLNASTCVGGDKNWDAAQNTCFVCKNGGTWSTKYSSCLYNAIPNEGATCSAAELGCREYNGNSGGNLKLLASFGFENGLDPFKAVSGTISQSVESTAKDGHSLAYSGGDLEIDTQSLAKTDSSYVIKFMAKSASDLTLNAYFVNAAGEKTVFNISDINKTGDLAIKGNNSWNLYEISSAAITHKIDSEKLKIKISGAIFIDNIIINEITDRYYLIKGSATVPASCSYDIFGKYQGPNYNLGCSLYQDRSNNSHFLHQFSELCQNSAVGCEQMIETANAANPYGRSINLNDADRNKACVTGDAGCLSVPEHKITYAVYDETKACVKDDAGCSRFAYSQALSGSTTWVDAYKKNLPDQYDSILCQSGEVGCEAWSYGDKNSTSYFKNPGNDVCVFRSENWYKAPVKRCDTNSDTKITLQEKNGAICVSDAECSGKKCITDDNDYPCEVSYTKTIGNGGYAGAIPTPSKTVGLCEAVAAGCTEFIDPTSNYNNNVIVGDSAQKLKQNTLYILKGQATLTGFSSVNGVSGDGTVRILGADNILGAPVATITSTVNATVIFYTGTNSYLKVSGNLPEATLKQSIINYKLDSDIDKTTCAGVVNTENGCVLFNNRSRSAGALSFTTTPEGAGAVACSGANCFANQVLKVRPDRVCSRWLACSSYIEDPITKEKTCYAMGECDKLNEKNECGNILPPSTEIRAIDNGTSTTTSFFNTNVNRNATGYSVLNDYYLGSMKEVGQNTDAHFDFENASASLSCQKITDSSPCNLEQSVNKDSLVLGPDNSPAGINYPAHGKGFLKVYSYYKISPQLAGSYIDVYGGQNYYINYLVNTQNSAVLAKITIVDETDATPKVIATSNDKANYGWERKVFKFNISGHGKELRKIKIYLSGVDPNDSSKIQNAYVYFDDINIEPVLEVAKEKYVAKDCRLYPGADSLSCLSANNNIIKDGLYGYCLQYDPLNLNSCLMWYPIDKIAPITRSTQATLGYQGKFPLYYCAEVNGNFKLMKKIKAVRVEAWYDGTKGGRDDYCEIQTEANCKIYCGDNNCDNYDLVFQSSKGKHDSAVYTNVVCIPKKGTTIGILGTETNITNVNPEGNPCNLSLYGEAWAEFNNGFSTVGRASSTDRYNEENNPLPNIAINDNNNPAVTSDDIKFIADIDPEKVFRLTCNRFIQTVDEVGNNMAWTARVSKFSIFPTSTPSYFISGTNDHPENINYSTGANEIYAYGRNREDVPFGAAILPSDFILNGSAAINLRNQYSAKNNETMLAGRPYGCSLSGLSAASGCSSIGQCNINPNIFCIYTGNASMDKQGCSVAGGGQCVPLWKTPLINPSSDQTDSVNVLSKLFAKNYSNYFFNSNIYIGDINNKFKFPNIKPCPDNIRPNSSPESFCQVTPKVSNAVMKFVNENGTFSNVAVKNGKAAVDRSGLYKLTFNSEVDLEQQPLKQIVISWGDNIQVVTNLDNRPSTNNPHEFYHYYLGNSGNEPLITVTIFDNWGKQTCTKLGGGEC